MSLRVAIVALSGFLVTFLIFLDAYKRKKQFYPTVVYLSNHQPLLSIVCFQLIILALLFAKLLSRMFFGTLQQAEMDNVVSQSWYTLVDTCVVFALFQDELGVEFIMLFLVLLFMRVFHWLLHERVDYMGRTPAINRLFHIRMLSLIIILGFTDLYLIQTNYWIKISNVNSVKLVLGVEFCNLLFSLIITLVRYIMHSLDTMREHPWDKKAMYLLYVEIIVGALRLCLYIHFTVIMLKLHPFPLFVARPLLVSIKTLKNAVRDVYMSRQAIRYLNTIFPNATAADLAASSDTVCIICREEMQAAAEDGTGSGAPAPASSLKRLPCSHILHTNCLLSWFQRQQTCPTCRMQVLRQPARPQGQAAAAPPSGGPSAAASATSGGQADTATAARDATTGTGAASASLPAGGQLPWTTLPGLPAPFFAFPPAPTTESAAETGQPVQGQPTVFPYMFPHMYMQTPFLGMPMIYPGPLFPPVPTSPMPAPPAELPEGASDAQLQASTIARFTALRQVNVLLQAAVLQMNAYLSAVTEPTGAGLWSDATVKSSDLTLATASSTTTATATVAPASTPASSDSVGGTVGKADEEEVTGKLLPDCAVTVELGSDRPPSYVETSDASTPDSNQPGTLDDKDLVVVRNRWLLKVESQTNRSDKEKPVSAND